MHPCRIRTLAFSILWDVMHRPHGRRPTAALIGHPCKSCWTAPVVPATKKRASSGAPSLLRSLWSSPYSPSSASQFGDSRMGSGSPPGRSLVVGERRDGGPPPKVEGRRPSTSCEVRWEGSAVVPGGLRPPTLSKTLPGPGTPLREQKRTQLKPSKLLQAPSGPASGWICGVTF